MKKNIKNGAYEEYGIITYYKDNLIHREDGPAIVWPDGRKMWYIHGKRHREDGPACELSETDKEWWINGQRLTLEEFNQWLDKKNLHEKLDANLEYKSIQKRSKI